MPSSRGTKRKERNVLRRERPDVHRRISKEPDSFPSINPTSSSCIGYTGARLLRTLTPLGIIDIRKSAYVNRFQKLLDHEQPAAWLFPRNHVRYNLQEWFSLEKLLDKNEARNQIGKRVKRRICRPDQSRLGGQPNDRFIPEAVARRMFASLTLSSCRLS
jgi:hypothetical protein